MCRCTDKKKERALVFLVRFVKIFGINLFFDCFLPFFFSGKNLWASIKACVDILSMLVAIVLTRQVMHISWEKFGMIFLIADTRAFACTMLPPFLCALAHKLSLIDFVRYISKWDYLACIMSSIFVLLLTQSILTPFCKWAKKNEPAHGFMWLGLFYIYCICQLLFSSSGLCIGKWTASYTIIWNTILVLFAIVFYIFMAKKQAQYLCAKNEYLDMQNRMIEEYYDHLQNQILLTKKYRHDIENHMQTISGLLLADPDNKQLMQEYLQALKAQQRELEPLSYCDNLVINAAIINKLNKCKQKGIRFHVDFSKMDLGSVSEMDFLSVLFNVWDNAIEWCEKQTDSSLKEIDILCYAKKGQLILIEKNGVTLKEDEPVIFESTDIYEISAHSMRGVFLSSKKTEGLRGVGFKILTEMIKKYKGDMDVRYAEHFFSIRMNFPNS